MTVTVAEFWRLTLASGLVAPEQQAELVDQFGRIKGAGDHPVASTLAQWLVSQDILTLYQTRVLLSGRPGPFDYGDYRLAERLDNGPLRGMFRARHRPTRHPVMLDFVAGPWLTDASCWNQAAQRTADWTQRVNRHLVRFFAAVDQHRYRFFVMEDLHGESLAQRLQRGPMSIAEAAHVGRLAAMGLAVLHQTGEVLGDLQPDTVWLEPEGNVKLLANPRFGPLGNQADEAQLRRAEYAAPDRASGPTPKTDIYALGCVLYQAIAGQPPFPGGDIASKQARHAQDPITPPSAHTSPGLLKAITYMMAKNASLRTEKAYQVADQLLEFVDEDRRSFRPPRPPATISAMEKALREQASQPATPANASANAGATGMSVSSGATRSTVAPPNPVAAPTETAPPKTGDTAWKPQIVTERKPLAPRGGAPRRPSALGGVLGWTVIGGLAAGLLGAMGYWVSRYESEQSRARPPRLAAANPGASERGEDRGGSSADTTTPPEVAGGAGGASGGGGKASGGAGKPPKYEVLDDDDGASLWESPTAGPPLDMRFSPSNYALLLAIRPAALSDHPQGAAIYRALGPGFNAWRKSWEGDANLRLDEIDRLHVTVHAQPDDSLKPAYVVQLKTPTPRDQLLKKWGAKEVQVDDVRLHQRGDWTFYLPADPVTQFAMGGREEMKDVAQRKGAAPPIRRAAARLLENSDAERHLNLLLFPHDLSTKVLRDGLNTYFGPPRRLREPLDWFLGDGLQAALLSAHVDDFTFLELRFKTQADVSSQDMADRMRARLEETPPNIKTYLAREINPPVYWREFAFQFPAIVRFLHRQTRVQAEKDQAIINAHLPQVALHNLIFGGEMLVSSEPGAAAGVAAAQPVATGPQTLEEVLKTKTTISFPQKSLEFALEAVVEDVRETHPRLPFPFRIRILGSDLEARGITRNQQISDFKQSDATIADVLTAMVRKANPDPSATGPADPKQVLVWVVGVDPDAPAERIVLVTTRDAAAKNSGYLLPKVFDAMDNQEAKKKS